MSKLALAALSGSTDGLSARWAHDIRNALATVGLHLETLQRLSGSSGREVASAAQAIMLRAAAMCNEAIVQGTQMGVANHRRGFDIVKTIVQVANLLRPATPEGLEIRVAGSGTFAVLADPEEIFRILFNLVNNAVTVARQGDKMTHVTLLVERVGINVTVRVCDDWPRFAEGCTSQSLSYATWPVADRRQRAWARDCARTCRAQRWGAGAC